MRDGCSWLRMARQCLVTFLAASPCYIVLTLSVEQGGDVSPGQNLRHVCFEFSVGFNQRELELVFAPAQYLAGAGTGFIGDERCLSFQPFM